MLGYMISSYPDVLCSSTSTQHLLNARSSLVPPWNLQKWRSRKLEEHPWGICVTISWWKSLIPFLKPQPMNQCADSKKMSPWDVRSGQCMDHDFTETCTPKKEFRRFTRWFVWQLSQAIYESWAKGPWKGFPLRKPLGMQLTVSAKVFFWNGERKFVSGESFGESSCTHV